MPGNHFLIIIIAVLNFKGEERGGTIQAVNGNSRRSYGKVDPGI
jgi:hypothetical protein